MKKIACILALILALCPLFALAEETESGKLAGYIVILHTGNLSQAKSGNMRLDQVEEARLNFIEEGADVLLLDTGNAFGVPTAPDPDAAADDSADSSGSADGDAQESAAVTLTDEEAALIKAMNQAGYDAMAPGTYDLALGYDHLQAIIQTAGFTLTCVNALKDDGSYMVNGTTVKHTGGVQIGLFGLIQKADIPGVTIPDAVETAQEKANALRSEGCELIIAMSSLGTDENGDSLAVALANRVEGLDIVIDITAGAPNSGKWLDNGVLVVSGGDALKNIGAIIINPAGNCGVLTIDKSWIE